MLTAVMPSLWALPTKPFSVHMKKSCGRDLVERVDRICRSRGGHMTYTRAHRARRGIVDECCMKKCADHHIYAYCSNNKPSTESNSDMLEIPTSLTMDLETVESRVPAVFTSQLVMDNDNVIPLEPVTNAPLVKKEYPKFQIIVKEGVKDEAVAQIMKHVPAQSNHDFQVGTVPPQLMSRYIPSRARIITNY